MAISWIRKYVLIFLQPVKAKMGLEMFELLEMGPSF